MSKSVKTWYRSWPVDVAIRVLYFSGLLHLVGLIRKYVGRKRLLVLMYHRLSAETCPAAIAGIAVEDAVPVEHFESHMRLLRWFGEPLALDEAYESMLDRSQGPRSLIAVTFDDGYRDNFLLGQPVWSKHRVPVAIFPAAAAVDRGQWLWWDDLLRIIGQADLAGRELRPVVELLEDLTGAAVRNDALPRATDRVELAHFLSQQLVLLPMEIRDSFLPDLAEMLDVDPLAAPRDEDRAGGAALAGIDRLYLNWDELKHQVGDGVQVGGHTIGHPRLPLENVAVAEQEITGCRTMLQQRMGQPVNCFAYPGGYYGDRELDLVARAGYRVAVTIEKGANYPDTNPFRLRRIGVSYDGPHHLAFKLAFCDWLFR